MVKQQDLSHYLSECLSVDQFHDYCPNGLQVEGNPTIQTLISGVTADQTLINLAIDRQADAIIVHHGLFWRGESQSITGLKKRRLAALLQQNMNLFAYHLPLDVHPQYGNNRQLADQLAIEVKGQFKLMGTPNLGWFGQLKTATTLEAFGHTIQQQLQRQPLLISGHPKKTLHSIAWCSGAAQDGIVEAAQLGVDAYLSGEVSERTYYQAKELNIHYIAAGHHATERGGIIALAQHLADQFGLDHQFIDTDNPI